MNQEERGLELRRTLSDIVRKEHRRGGMAIINAVVDHPEAKALIEAMDAEEMYALVLDLGRTDSMDLVSFGTQEQFQGLMDLDLWQDRTFRPDRVEDWLALTSMDRETVERFVESMDDETVVLYLSRRARIVARTHEPEQDDEVYTEDVEVVKTPDNLFYLVMPAQDPHIPAVRQFIELLYDRDSLDTAALLKHAVYEDIDQLEEEAAHHRSGRVASMGFPDLEETEELFRYINPVKYRDELRKRIAQKHPFDTPEETLLPALWDLGQNAPVFLQRVMDNIDSPALRDRVMQAVAYLANAVMVHETGGDLARAEDRKLGLSRALGLLSVGLEFVADRDVAQACVVIARVWPKTLFRVGHSLILPLRQRAERLLPLAGHAHGLFLFDPPLDEVLRAALEEVPRYVTSLDGEAQGRPREFASMTDIQRTGAALRQAEVVGRFVEETLHPDLATLAAFVPEKLRPVVTHTTLMATALVNALLGHEDLVAPLPLAEIRTVMDVVLQTGDEGKRTVHPRLAEAVQHFLSREQNQFAAALFDLALRKLEALFQRFPTGVIPDVSYVMPTLLVTDTPRQ